jgi:hypothetical protein
VKRRILRVLRVASGTALVGIAFLNLWAANRSLAYLKPRREDAVVVWEDRLRYVRNALMKAGYFRGDVGYVPAGVLQGRARTTEENTDWVQARYVMIPWNLLQDNMDTPYVIVDFSRSKGSIDSPPAFVKLYDSGDGLTLLRRTSSP